MYCYLLFNSHCMNTQQQKKLVEIFLLIFDFHLVFAFVCLCIWINFTFYLISHLFWCLLYFIQTKMTKKWEKICKLRINHLYLVGERELKFNNAIFNATINDFTIAFSTSHVHRTFVFGKKPTELALTIYCELKSLI